MRCPKCGKSIDASTIQCPVCHTIIQQQADYQQKSQSEIQYQPQLQSVTNSAINDKSRKKLWIGVAIGVVLVVVGVVCYFMFFSTSSKLVGKWQEMGEYSIDAEFLSFSKDGKLTIGQGSSVEYVFYYKVSGDIIYVGQSKNTLNEMFRIIKIDSNELHLSGMNSDSVDKYVRVS